MYQMLTIASLTQVLNRSSVCMFAVERATPAAPFTVSVVNNAMLKEGADVVNNVCRCSLNDLLSQTDFHRLETHLAANSEAAGSDNSDERFQLISEAGIWDVTLQPMKPPGGGDRVIVTVLGQRATAAPPTETLAFEDIQYFSSMADYQIQNLIALFENLQDADLFETASEQRIAKLSGMCRTVQRAVADIRKTIQNANGQSPSSAKGNLPISQMAQMSALDRCGTLKALTDFSSEKAV